MATLFNKQAKTYAEARPKYPLELYKLLASLTTRHKRAWDVGTGSGQAAVGLAEFFEEVIATDASADQLQHATLKPNISYHVTPAQPTWHDLQQLFPGDPDLDLITVAQAIHWFDLPTFYSHVRRLLRRPGGIIAAWCYTNPTVNADVDAVLAKVFESTLPYWAPNLGLVYAKYATLDFPFEGVQLPHQTEIGTGPIHMEAIKEDSTLEAYLGFLESWSAIHTARTQGVELLGEDVRLEFLNAWGGFPDIRRSITFPLHLRVGVVS